MIIRLDSPTVSCWIWTVRILDKTESAGRFLHLVQTHDDALDVATFAKQFVDLFLGGVVREISHIQGGGGQQCLLLLSSTSLTSNRNQKMKKLRHNKSFKVWLSLTVLKPVYLIPVAEILVHDNVHVMMYYTFWYITVIFRFNNVINTSIRLKNKLNTYM